jgi:hypothetical protein
MRFAHVLAAATSAVIGSIGVAPAARAATVYATGFEAPSFTNGQVLLGTDGWSTAIPPFLSPNAAKISTAGPASGQQHVRVLGTDMVSAAEVGPDEDAVGSYRRPVSFDSAAAGLPIVRVEADVRLNGAPILGAPIDPNGDGHTNYLGPDTLDANIGARSNDGGVGELGISSDGYIYAYNNASTEPIFVRPTTLNTYHHLAIEVNFAQDKFQYFVDGTPLGTAVPFDAGFTSDTLLRGALITYARSPASARADHSYDFDNFSITATPEPGTAGLALAASAALLHRRRRSSRGR